MSERTEPRPAMPAPAAPTMGGFIDPFQMWKQWYDASEQTWAKALEQAVGTPEYAQTMGKTMEAFLAFQRTVRDNMRLYLEAVNLPTREDIARMGTQVVNLESKIDDLDDRLDEMLTTVEGMRTSASSSAMASRLDAIERQLGEVLTTVKALRGAGTGRKAGGEPAPAGNDGQAVPAS